MYVYIGIGDQIKSNIKLELHENKTIDLLFHFDGLSIFNSTSLEFWPIAAKIFNENSNVYKPFFIAVHSGVGKPKSVENIYMILFVNLQICCLMV